MGTYSINGITGVVSIWAFTIYFSNFLFIRMFPEENVKKVFIHPYTYIRYAFHCIFTSKERYNKLRAHATYSLNTCLYTCIHFLALLYSFPLFALLLLLPMLSSLSLPTLCHHSSSSMPYHHTSLSLFNSLPTHILKSKLEVGVGNVAHK